MQPPELKLQGADNMLLLATTTSGLPVRHDYQLVPLWLDPPAPLAAQPPAQGDACTHSLKRVPVSHPSREGHPWSSAAGIFPACSPAFLNCVLKSSKLPNEAVMASASLPLGSPPPLRFMLSQKKVWFHTCTTRIQGVDM